LPFDDKQPDIDSLKVNLLNDSLLEDDSVQDTFSDGICATFDLESSNIVAAADRAGLFGIGKDLDLSSSSVGYPSLGEASLMEESDRQLMFLQSNLMTELSKKKRPTPSGRLSEVAVGKHRQIEIVPRVTFKELEDLAHVDRVLPESLSISNWWSTGFTANEI
jgi:hypothetical protein